MKGLRLAGILVGLIWGWAAVCAEVPAQSVTVDIPRSSLNDALKQLAGQAGFQVVFYSTDSDGLTTKPLSGKFTAQQALTELLAGTGLTYRYLGENTVAILGREGFDRGTVPAGASNTVGSAADSPSASIAGTAVSILLSQSATSSAATPSPSQGEVKSEDKNTIAEIIVTAQKKSERIQDVPGAVTVVNTDELLENNQVRLQDYYERIPGFNVSPAPSSTNDQTLTIRGITTGWGTNPTVGITIDDAPFGASTGNAGGGNVVPDLDPSDLARVEVLRGPQGTLYGSSSMGGLVKFVTVDPSTNALSGRLQSGFDFVHNGAQVGYTVRGAVNIPISDSIAVRASGFKREDPGYINNPALNIDGVNKSEVYGGRLSALWRPSDVFSVKLSALYQDTKQDGTSYAYVLPTLGDLQENDILRGGSSIERRIQAYSAVINTQFDGLKLISVTGYNVNDFRNSNDSSATLGGLVTPEFPACPNGGCGAQLTTPGKTDKVTQELRLTSSVGHALDWLLAGFYTHEDSQVGQNLLAVNPANNALVGTSLNATTPSTYSEYAIFAGLTAHITDKFAIQFGGRESHIKQSFFQALTGPLVPGEFTYPQRNTTANVFTYLVTPKYNFTPDLMAYARFASGYRPGVQNLSLNPAVPPASMPDRTYDYEVGFKGDFLNRALSLDLSLYYIDWKDLQLFFTGANDFGYQNNASRAKSEGVELSAESRPWAGADINAWVAFNDAVLTENIPPSTTVYGLTGDRLPNSSRFSGSLSFEQAFPLMGAVTGFANSTLSYFSNTEGIFSTSAATPRQYFPGYARVDLSAGFRCGPWTANAYANNIADKRAAIGGGIGTFPPYAFAYIQPRTIGLTVIRSF